MRVDTVAPFVSCLIVECLTSLFGGSWGGMLDPEGSIGATEPWEKFREGESGPMLDLGLPCWDNGRTDQRLLIHEPLDENESLDTSDIGGGTLSFCRMAEYRGLTVLGGVVWDAVAGRDWRWLPEADGNASMDNWEKDSVGPSLRCASGILGMPDGNGTGCEA